MKNIRQLFVTAAACAAFTLAATAYTGCANSTGTTASDTTSTQQPPAATDTMSNPSSTVGQDTTMPHRDSM